MDRVHVPTINARYWTAIIVASMCGANSGDFVARYLGLGHINGLAPLGLAFLAIIAAERQTKIPTEIFYWLAIILLRTAATNLADLGTHDLKIDYVVFEAGLALSLIVAVAADNLFPSARPVPVVAVGGTVPRTNGAYWIAMLIAGTLGTALGDYVADIVGLGVGFGSIVLTAVFIAVLAAALVLGRMTKPWYWLTIVAARTVGTTLGDYLASRKGAGLGLPLSFAITSAALAAVVLLWRHKPVVQPAAAAE